MFTRWIGALLVAGLVLVAGPRPGSAHTAEPQGAGGPARASAETLGASVAQLTQSLLGSHAMSGENGVPLTSRETDDLVAVATLRQQLLSALLEVDPGEVLRLAIPPTLRARLAPEVLPHVEEHVQVEGEVEALYEDWANSSRLRYVLKSGAKSLDLHFAGERPEALTGDRVRVRGVRVSQALAARATGGDLQVLAAAAQASTIGEQKTLVILVTLADKPTPPASQETVRSVVFEQADAFFREASYGRTWLSGDVTPWLPVAVSSTSCDYYSVASAAKSAAVKAGFAPNQYRRLIYMFPALNCGWLGMGTVGGNPSQAWINGHVYPGPVAHEMGHNFGLYHSNALECGATAIGPSCSRREYGDVVDVMGNAYGHYNAFQKERLGWLNSNGSPPITTVQASGTYVIERYETASTTPKALKVVKQVAPSGLATWYYLEYRQPVGVDRSLASGMLNGAVFHLNSDLLDMTPSTSSWYDGTLQVGRSFTDAEAGVTITPLSANGMTLAVRVTLGGGPGGPVCVPDTPTVTLAPTQSQWVRPGTAVTYAVSVTNEDPAGCQASPFTLQVTPPGGWQVSGVAGPLTIAAGASASTSIQVTSAPGTPDGFHSVLVTAMKNGSASEAATAVATYVVSSPGGTVGDVADGFDRPDSTTLGNGWAEMAGDLSISAGVLTNAGIKGLHLAVLPELIASSQDVAADFTLDGPRKAGRYGLVLRFQDADNYYAVYRQVGGTSNVQIAKVVNGVETILKTGKISNPRAGFQVSGRADGSVITVEVDGIEKATVADDTFTTGSAGVYLQATQAGVHRVDNFSATLR